MAKTERVYVVFNSGFPQGMPFVRRSCADEYVELHLKDSPEVEIKQLRLSAARRLFQRQPETRGKRERRHSAKGEHMKKDSRNKHNTDLDQQIERLRLMRDEEIDTSDIPELQDWSKSVVGKFYKPEKQAKRERS